MSGSVEGFGPAGPVAGEGPPFALAGPSAVALDGARSGSASFTVSNVTGRPVRARLAVVPGTGADASWFQIAGESERALPVAGTATVDVTVKAGEKAPAGSYSFALGAALEEAPDHVVSGPTVGFEVKAATKKFPWWIVIVAAVAVVLLVGGGILIWLLTRGPSAPTLSQAPTISGAVEVGSELTVQPGVWDPGDVVRVHTWQMCPETAPDEGDEGCQDIVVGTGEQAETAPGPTYVVGPEVVGMRIRVVETAVRVDPETLSAAAPDDLSDFPFASAASATTDPVPSAEPDTAAVPSVIGLTYSNGQAVLSAAGFQVDRDTTNETGNCDPAIEVQEPDPGQVVEKGSLVEVTTKQRLPLSECLAIVQNDDVVVLGEWFLQTVDP